MDTHRNYDKNNSYELFVYFRSYGQINSLAAEKYSSHWGTSDKNILDSCTIKATEIQLSVLDNNYIYLLHAVKY